MEARTCRSTPMKARLSGSSSRIDRMHHHAVFDSLHRGTPLAASVDSKSTDRLAWVGVYPLDLERHTTREFLRNQGVQVYRPSGRVYGIRSSEVQSRLIEADVSIGETE